ncbi:MAG TPA: pyridoxamine 5'-phosphate oxidase family protein [Steroidobacteraceae bacterium]|nr:pyridoxamine 5'-phosphate oxidase family protein [Steroidobacteraceae bacterium]
MSEQSTPAATQLKLPQALKDTINSALARGRMLSVAYVSPEGRPELSFRGSVQAYDDAQLAIWVRNPEGGIVHAVRSGRPHIALLYGELGPQSKAFVSFRGRGRIEDAEAVRRRVYDGSPELERNLDKDRKGVPLIIELDSVDGFFGGAALKMRR